MTRQVASQRSSRVSQQSGDRASSAGWNAAQPTRNIRTSRQVTHDSTAHSAFGGLPRGCITQTIGRGTAGLTTLALKVVAHAQHDNDAAAWLDVPLTFDAEYAVRCGVALDRLLVVRSGENIADVLYALVGSRAVGVLVCDLRSRDVRFPDTSALSRLMTALASTSCALVFLTEPDTPLNTHAIALRLGLECERWLMRGRDVSGYRVQVEVLKNRFAPAGRCVSLTIGLDAGARSGTR